MHQDNDYSNSELAEASHVAGAIPLWLPQVRAGTRPGQAQGQGRHSDLPLHRRTAMEGESMRLYGINARGMIIPKECFAKAKEADAAPGYVRLLCE